MTNGKERFAICRLGICHNHSTESKVDAPSTCGAPDSSQLEAAPTL